MSLFTAYGYGTTAFVTGGQHPKNNMAQTQRRPIAFCKCQVTTSGPPQAGSENSPAPRVENVSAKNESSMPHRQGAA